MATFQKRGDKWRAIVRKAGNRPVSKSFTTKSAAQFWAREVERDMDRREWNDPKLLDGTTLGDLITRYRLEMPPSGKTKTACLNMLERELGDVELIQLDKQRIIRYIKHRSSEHGAGPATVAQDLIYLRGILATAKTHWDIPVNVAAAEDARAVLRREGKVGRPVERDRRPTEAELELLRAYWGNPRLREMTTPMWTLVQFAILSAMRLSEICRIEWGDLNEQDRTVVIRDRKHPTEKRGNDQEVPLLGEAWDIVQAQPKRDARIFPYKSATVSNLFTRAVQRQRIVDLHFHDLRHHAISLLFERGYQVQEVGLVSGHRDWRQLRRYTQIRAKDLHR